MTNTVDPYDVAEAIISAQLERDALDERITALKDQFRDARSSELVRDGRPTIIVKVTTNTRIDDSLAKRNLDVETYNMVSKSVIDTAKARAFLSNEELSQITKQYANKVEIKFE